MDKFLNVNAIAALPYSRLLHHLCGDLSAHCTHL